jgi:hypothetical protein
MDPQRKKELELAVCGLVRDIANLIPLAYLG